MDDLISRKTLLKEIQEEYDLNYGEILINPIRFYDMVDCQPTAYDVNEIIKQLKEECIKIMNKRLLEDESHMHSKGAQEMFLKAEKILKGAVKDE